MREHQYVVPKDSDQQAKQTYNAQGMALNGSDQYLHYSQYGCTDSSQIFPQLLPFLHRNPVSSKSTTTFPRCRRLSDIATQTMVWDLQTWGHREEKRDVPSTCVRDETRSARHLGNKIKTNISCHAGEDVLANISVPGTSTSQLLDYLLMCVQHQALRSCWYEHLAKKRNEHCGDSEPHYCVTNGNAIFCCALCGHADRHQFVRRRV